MAEKTIYYSDPLNHVEAKRKLRGEVYDFMCREASKPGNYAYYEYVRINN